MPDFDLDEPLSRQMRETRADLELQIETAVDLALIRAAVDPETGVIGDRREAAP